MKIRNKQKYTLTESESLFFVLYILIDSLGIIVWESDIVREGVG